MASKSAAAALKYFDEGLRREDYYSQEQEVIGKWQGKAAKMLELSGDVRREAFAALVENRHPKNGKALTPRTKSDRRVGYDLNFHAPKSLSILHALTGDQRIVEAFRAAVTETMAEIEALAATRVRRGGAQAERNTGNLVWAEFVHFTARPVNGVPDPHLHIHAFTFNATHDEVEGRWKAVSWAQIKKDGAYSEAVFHARLSEKIAGLGYGIERTRDRWEVAGMPRSLIEKFSRRTAQIEEVAKRRGITSAKERDALGAATREGKRKGLTKNALLKLWSDRLMPAEQSLLAKLRRGEIIGERPEKITPDMAFEAAEAKMFSKNSVVQSRRLVAEALRYGVGQVTPERAWSEFSRREMLERDISGERLCTTRAVLAEELQLIGTARSGRSSAPPLVGGAVKYSNAKLSVEQQLAVRHIVKSRDRIIGLRGVAGAGKTTSMAEVVVQIHAAGFKVFAFAPSASASRGTLRGAGFKNAETIAHLLHNKNLQKETRGQVIWIDEAGQVGVRDMLEIMRIAGDSTRIILTGDVEQHAPVARGDAFRLMQHYAGLKVAELSQIRRQELESYRKAVAALSRGDLREGFRRLEEMNAIFEVVDDAERYRMLAQDFVGLSRGASMPLVISPTHLEGATVTAAIREARRDAGLLGPDRDFTQFHDLKWEGVDCARPENYRAGMMVQLNQNITGYFRGAQFTVTRDGEGGRVRVSDTTGRELDLPLESAAHFSVFEQRKISLARGDRIRITRNGESADGRRLNNGDLAVIAKIARGGTIILKSGAELNPDHGHFAYGYCQTSHSSQSMSVRDVLVAQSERSFLASSREQFYVSVSRGKGTLRIYTDDIRQLQEAVGNSSKRRAGVELLGLSSEHVAAMSEGALNSEKWQKLIQSRRNVGVGSFQENLKRERGMDGTAKRSDMTFQQYIALRRAQSGPDGKSRSKGHPSTPGGKRSSMTEGKSFARPTELTKGTTDKIAQAKTKTAPKPRTPPTPKQNRVARALEAGKKHFGKMIERTKSAVKGARKRLFPERGNQAIAKTKTARRNPAKGKSKTKTKTAKQPVIKPRK